MNTVFYIVLPSKERLEIAQPTDLTTEQIDAVTELFTRGTYMKFPTPRNDGKGNKTVVLRKELLGQCLLEIYTEENP